MTAHELIAALQAGMGITDRQEAALRVIRREAVFNLRTQLPEGQTWQERHDALCQQVIALTGAALGGKP